MDTVKIGKLEAASRQFDVAIKLLFAGEDILAVHTLAGASANILSDLVEFRAPAKSWDRQAQDVVRIDAKTYFNIARKTQNFLKHADRDPDGELEFSVTDTTAVMMAAAMNLAELQMLTIPQSVFQLWWLACNLDVVEPGSEIRAVVKTRIGKLDRRTLSYQLSVGRERLAAALAAIAA